MVNKIKNAIGKLEKDFLERKSVITGLFVSLLAGEHVLLLGPPGTAKSELARSFFGYFKDNVYFES